jgi:hypothetical protein
MQIKFAVMRDVYMCSQISINIFLSFQYWFANRTVLQKKKNNIIYLFLQKIYQSLKEDACGKKSQLQKNFLYR